MAVDVTTEIVIDRPVEVVAAYAADPANAPSWYVNIDRVEVLDERHARFEARFLGRTMRYTYEIAEHVPGERLVMRTTDGPFPMETTYTWSAEGPLATRMSLGNRGGPPVVGVVMAPFVRRATRKDLAALKAMLERSSSSSS